MDRGTTVTDFAAVLRDRRKAVGISQNELSKRAAVDHSYIFRLENGYRNPPRREIVDALASALHLTRLEHDAMLVAAGYAPKALMRAGWSHVLSRIVAIMITDDLSDTDRARILEEVSHYAAYLVEKAIAK